jgi:hypothetical protein
MALPTTRQEFANYCLRQLGAPVIEINVAAEQIDDCIDDALLFYRDYHYDGSERTFLKHTVTQTDLDNKFIPCPDPIIGVINLDSQNTVLGSGMFNAQYQWALNNMHSLVSGGGGAMANYAISMTNLEMLNDVFNGMSRFRFNRRNNKLFIDEVWGTAGLALGDTVVAEVYMYVDPEDYSEVWNDLWLKKYCTQLIKRSWGNNLKKFQGLQMPGGLTFDGQTIYNEADAEIKKMEEEVQTNFSGIQFDMIG